MKGLLSYKKIWAICVLLLVGAFTVGYLVCNEKNPDMVQRPDQAEIAQEQVEQRTGNTYADYAAQPVTTPDTRLIFKTLYLRCGHTAVERQDIQSRLVGLKEEELMEHYPDWETEKFQSEEIILFRQVEGACPGHYVLKVKNGYVAIFIISDNGKEMLAEVTDIPLSILRLKDQERLRNGILLDGIEEVNQYLEDLGS